MRESVRAFKNTGANEGCVMFSGCTAGAADDGGRPPHPLSR
jgi:hypothetical protein